MFRMWPHHCGLNVGGSVSYWSQGLDMKGLGVSSPCTWTLTRSLTAFSKVEREMCEQFLAASHHGFELTSRPGDGLGQLIYLTTGTCELPDVHILHLQPDLLHPDKSNPAVAVCRDCRPFPLLRICLYFLAYI